MMKVKVAESDSLPSDAVSTSVPGVVLSSFKSALGVKVSPSSWPATKVMPSVIVTPSKVVKTPVVGIESTVMVRTSPSASVGAPIPKEAGMSSVKSNVKSAPALGAAFAVGVGAPAE